MKDFLSNIKMTQDDVLTWWLTVLLTLCVIGVIVLLFIVITSPSPGEYAYAQCIEQGIAVEQCLQLLECGA